MQWFLHLQGDDWDHSSYKVVSQIVRSSNITQNLQMQINKGAAQCCVPGNSTQ